MKEVSRSRLLIVLGIALAMILFSILVVDSRIKDASDEISVRHDELQSEYDRLKKIDDSSGEYTVQTDKFNAAYDQMIGEFPCGITQNNQIMFLRGVEDEFDLRITTASYTDPEAVYQFLSVMPGNQEGYTLVRSTLQFPMQLSYSEWKRFIKYLEESGGLQVLETVSASYDNSNGMVDADVTISEYAITGDDRKEVQKETEVETGTDNIFYSGSPLSAGAGYQYYNAGTNESGSGIRNDLR